MLIAGSVVPEEGGTTGAGTCACGEAFGDFERSTGTATIPASSTATTGHSRFCRSPAHVA
jgi:hypothetical protein